MRSGIDATAATAPSTAARPASDADPSLPPPVLAVAVDDDEEPPGADGDERAGVGDGDERRPPRTARPSPRSGPREPRPRHPRRDGAPIENVVAPLTGCESSEMATHVTV